MELHVIVTAASTVDPNAIAAPLARGTSTNAPVSTNDFYASKPVMSISRSDDTGAQAYFQVTLTAAAGFELNMDNWTFDGARGGGATPRTYEVHSVLLASPEMQISVQHRLRVSFQGNS